MEQFSQLWELAGPENVSNFEAVVLEKRKKERKTREGVRNISCNFAMNARDEEREVTDEK